MTDNNAPTGNGTRRECNLKDGKNWLREEIVDYVPLQEMVIDIYESSLPIKTMQATFGFRRLGEAQTEVTMKSEFEPTMGVVGKLMAPLMARRFRPMLIALLEANAAYVEKGQSVPQAA